MVVSVFWDIFFLIPGIFLQFSYVIGACIYNQIAVLLNPSKLKLDSIQNLYFFVRFYKVVFGIPREDSALGLPLGMGTKIVCKHNLRNLIDMSHQRECSRAYHEYRGLFADVGNALREYSDEWAYLVDHYFMPKCEYFGFCREKKSCGRKGRRVAE